MGNILKILRRDVRRIAKNPVAVIITVALCFLPAIYAWFNIIANWNPYGNTSGIKVVIANEDTGATVESMGELNLGDQVVALLKENDQLDWEFADKQQALDDVYSGAAYAAIVIPADFSKDLTSITTGKVTLPELDYYMNEKLSPVAGKVTDTGADTIETEINTQFVNTVATVVTNALKSAAKDVSTSTNSATITALSHIQSARDSLDASVTAIGNTQATAAKAIDAIGQAKTDLDGLNGVISDTSDSLSSTIDSLNEAKDEIDQLSTTLSGDLVKTATAISSLSVSANKTLGDLSGTLGTLKSATDSAQQTLQDTYDSLETTYNQMSSTVSALPDGTVKTQLTDSMDKVKDQMDQVKSVLDRVTSTKSKIDSSLSSLESDTKSLNDGLADAADDLNDAANTLTTKVTPAINSALNSLVGVAQDLKGSVDGLPALVTQAQSTLDQLSTTLSQASDALGTTATTVTNLSTTLGNVGTDLSAISSSETYQALKDLIDVNTTDVASLISTPVTIQDSTIYPVANYGSGVAPFYTNLAIFVGALMLCTMYKMNVDNEGVEDMNATEGYFARLLLLTPLAVLQGVITCVGDLVIGIQCVSPFWFVFAGAVGGIVYLNLVYSLTVAFKHIGKALAVVLVILQIPGSSGLYPIEMQPEFFQRIYPLLPFTYGNNAMRETIAGFYGANYVIDLAVLCLFIAPALFIGIFMHKHFRNVDALFDQELCDTDLFNFDKTGDNPTQFDITTLMAAAMDSETYHDYFAERAERFQRRYPKLRNAGFIAIAVITPLGLLVSWLTDVKLIILLCWVIAVVLICCYLIVLEYMHQRVRSQVDLTAMSKDQVNELLSQQLKNRFHKARRRLREIGKDGE